MAESDFSSIVHWSIDRFGAVHGAAYRDIIASAIATLYEGPGAVGVRKREDIGTGVLALHVARAGQKGRHVVFFRVSRRMKRTVDVLRILHDAMDFSRHVG